MSSGLIGSTGLVGSTLLAQTKFDERYHRTDIAEIDGRSFDLLVCAGASAEKWRANREPEADRTNLDVLMHHLERVEADRFVLVSTVDVYVDPVGVDEDTFIEPTGGTPYGRHRHQLEEFCRERFGNAVVLRLPGLFGEGLKKNFVFDLLHHSNLDLTHAQSSFQFYDLGRLWKDAIAVLDAGAETVNLGTEPVVAQTVARACFGVEFTTVTPSGTVRYDMRTRHADLFGRSGPYLASADEVLAGIRDFVIRSRARFVGDNR